MGRTATRLTSVIPLTILATVFAIIVFLFADFSRGLTAAALVAGLCSCGIGSAAAIIASGDSSTNDAATSPAAYAVAYVYGICAVICAGVFIVMGFDDWRVFTAIEIIMLLTMIVLVVALGYLGRQSHRETAKIKSQTSFVQQCEAVANRCLDAAKSKGLPKETCIVLEKLTERIRFSDPSDSSDVWAIEDHITLLLSNIELAVANGDSGEITRLCANADDAIAERNRLCVVAR